MSSRGDEFRLDRERKLWRERALAAEAENDKLRERLDHPEYSARLLHAIKAEPDVWERMDAAEAEADRLREADEIRAFLSGTSGGFHTEEPNP